MKTKQIIGIIIVLMLACAGGYYFLSRRKSAEEASIDATPTNAPDEAAYQQMKSTFIGMLQDGTGIWGWLVKDVDERLKNPALIGNPDAAGTKTAALYSAIVTRIQAWVTGGDGTPTLYQLADGITYQQFSDTLYQQWVSFKNSQMYAGL